MQANAQSKETALNRLLRPRSVVIVGASPTPGSFGASVLGNLERAGFDGELYLVNPKRAEIAGRPCVASVDELPAGIDCAVLAIPRQSVIETVLACARCGVGGVIIFSAGFAEAGDEGRAEQKRIAEVAAGSGMMVEGPNCLGMVNYIDGVPLTFVTTEVERFSRTDGVAIVSQSGAMAAVLGVSLRNRQLGITYSISTGNEAANGVEDFVEHMLHESHTRVIAMIVEQFRQPKRFLALVNRAKGAGKTVVLLHPGKSTAAQSSAATHTGAMAGDYAVMKTKVEHAGVVLVDTLEELVDVTDLLLRCPPFTAGGAAVFTESGAFKALTLDFCEDLGLALPPLAESTAASLRAVLPDFIPPTNPLDITAQGLVDPDLYRRTLPPVLSDDQYSSVIMALILTDEGTSGLKFPPVLAAMRELKPTKPVLFVAMDEGARFKFEYVEQLRALGVPFFPSPERAFRAVARLTEWAAMASRSSTNAQSSLPQVTLERGVIPEYKSKDILRALDIPIPQGELATSLEAAQGIASHIGFPVVLKAQASALSHKSDAGGVALNVKDAAALETAWNKIYSDVAAAIPDLTLDGLLVETMGAKGAELIVGGRNDPDWGPVLLIGFGGVLAEALHDVRLLAPELCVDAIEGEISLLKSAALLHGFRGSRALDVRSAAGIASKIGKLLLAEPSIQEIDVNPVIVYPDGAVALDALIVVD